MPVGYSDGEFITFVLITLGYFYVMTDLTTWTIDTKIGKYVAMLRAVTTFGLFFYFGFDYMIAILIAVLELPYSLGLTRNKK